MQSRFSCLLAFLAVVLATVSAAAKQPNILLIVADDLGYEDLGFQGSADILSPNIDALAQGGIRFTDAHTTASVCSPSRAGLMTGRYQQRFGHESNSPPPPKGMDTNETTIAQRLSALGYRTAAIGKWHLGTTAEQYPTARGFDTFYGLREGGRGYFYDPAKTDQQGSFRAIERNGQQVPFDGYLTDVLGDQAIKFIDSPNKQPFFAYLSFTAPHGPMHATEEDLAKFAHITNKRRRTYAAMIWAMDRAIGKVISHLEETQQYDNTLIWFLSDNGGATNNASSNLPLAGHKGIKFEGGIRVPFVMHWPARFPKANVESGLVSALDILPTSVAAAGGRIRSDEPRPLDGVNLLPFLSGTQSGSPHQELFWHKLWFSAMRDGPWKLIYVQDYGYALYNLDDDLGEKHNVAAKYPQRVSDMTDRLNNWKSEMPAPLWLEGQQWFRIHSANHIRLIEGDG
ncbi:MAG: sulfatase-like hydrolase/transferase [Aureliella sp.]